MKSMIGKFIFITSSYSARMICQIKWDIWNAELTQTLTRSYSSLNEILHKLVCISQLIQLHSTMTFKRCSILPGTRFEQNTCAVVVRSCGRLLVRSVLVVFVCLNHPIIGYAANYVRDGFIPSVSVSAKIVMRPWKLSLDPTGFVIHAISRSVMSFKVC